MPKRWGVVLVIIEMEVGLAKINDFWLLVEDCDSIKNLSVSTSSWVFVNGACTEWKTTPNSNESKLKWLTRITIAIKSKLASLEVLRYSTTAEKNGGQGENVKTYGFGSEWQLFESRSSINDFQSTPCWEDLNTSVNLFVCVDETLQLLNLWESELSLNFLSSLFSFWVFPFHRSECAIEGPCQF